MAALPLNNLREQLRRHSARGALRAPGPPRDRPPGFTFRKAPRGLGAVLRDKDVNTSLAPPDGRAPVWGCAPPRSPAPRPVCASPDPSEPPKGPSEPPKGPAAPGAPSAAPAARPGPVITVGDDWDDIDDFDLSGIEKKFSRPALVSPKGLRGPRKEPPRPSPRPGPPGCAEDENAGPGGAGASPQAEEQRPCSQSSVICLEDSAPCSGSPAAGLGPWESPADPARDADSNGARPAAGAGGALQEQQGAGDKSPPELDEASWALAGAELEEDDLDIIPPSPEEELPPFSPSVQSVR